MFCVNGPLVEIKKCCSEILSCKIPPDFFSNSTTLRALKCRQADIWITSLSSPRWLHQIKNSLASTRFCLILAIIFRGCLTYPPMNLQVCVLCRWWESKGVAETLWNFLNGMQRAVSTGYSQFNTAWNLSHECLQACNVPLPTILQSLRLFASLLANWTRFFAFTVHIYGT
jgi:hypothetical protein